MIHEQYENGLRIHGNPVNALFPDIVIAVKMTFLALEQRDIKNW